MRLGITFAELRKVLAYVFAYLALIVTVYLILAVTYGIFYPVSRMGTLGTELLLLLAILSLSTIHPLIGLIALHILLWFAGIPHTEMVTVTLGIPLWLGMVIAQMVILPILTDYVIVGVLGVVLGYFVGRQTIPNIQEYVDRIVFVIKRR